MQYNNPVLQRFYESLGSKPHYMKTKGTGCRIADRDVAVRFPYIQLNQRRRAYLAFDIDHERGARAIEDAGLPPPTITMHKREVELADPKPQAVHVLYELTHPVSVGPHSRPRPVRFLEACEKKMAITLAADQGYRGYLVKSPLSGAWHVTTHDVTYELNKLWEYVQHVAVPQLKHSDLGRNSTLFDSVRHDVARILREEDVIADFDRVLNIADVLNSEFEVPLPISEVRCVARSVTRHFKRRGTPCQAREHGAMGLGAIEAERGTPEHVSEVRARQVAGGQFAAARRAQNSGIRVKDAVASLQAEGSKVTYDAVAKRAGVSRSQLYRAYSHLVRVVA